MEMVTKRPRTSRWANDGDPNSIQNPDYPLGTKERERPNERNRRGFESEIDPRPGIGSPEKRDGDSIKTPSQLDDLLEEVVELTNREREVNGLPALKSTRSYRTSLKKSQQTWLNSIILATNPQHMVHLLTC